MGSINLAVPQSGQPNSSEDVKVANDLTLIQTWANGNIDGANVAATITGRRLLMQGYVFFAGNAAASTLIPGAADAILSGSGTTNRGILWAHLDPANFAVTGKTNTQLIVRMSVATNATAPATNFTGALCPITFAGSANVIVPTAGAAVTGSSATVTAPLASSATVAETAAFTFPAAGAYTLAVTSAGGTAASSGQAFYLQLFALNS